MPALDPGRLRLQKTWGWLTPIANASYTVVGEPREGGVPLPRNDTVFLGLGAEAEVDDRLTLLADAYWRSADVPGEPARLAGDLGLKLRLSRGLALDAALGRSLRPGAEGGPTLRAYGGLKWEFGVF